MSTYRIIEGDVRERLADLDEASVQTCITSPPYWGLRDYGEEDQLGLEPTPEEYTENLVAVFREVRRVMRDDGTLWLNLGDSFGSNKQLVGIPWRVAFALQADGWYLRSDIIWHKPNPMPESVRDRPTKSHEYLFLLSKSPRYYYDADAIREAGTIPAGTLAAKGSSERAAQPGVNSRPPEYKVYDGQRNKRSVWTVTTKPFSGAHFAVFPPDLIEPCVLAGSAPSACGECGAPRRRITERTVSHESGAAKAGATQIEGKKHDDRNDLNGTGDVRLGPTVSVETVGWERGCECEADDAPQLVLDPFTGSGTTGMVALRHGRDFVGTELNPEYAQMARDRIQSDAPLLNEAAA